MRPVVILLVEDEPVIALDIQRILERDGHQILCAYSEGEVLTHCIGNQPDLVLINLNRAGIADRMSLVRLLHIRFRLPVLLVTGARAQDLPDRADENISFQVLHKPFTSWQLTAFLEENIQRLARTSQKD